MACFFWMSRIKAGVHKVFFDLDETLVHTTTPFTETRKNPMMNREDALASAQSQPGEDVEAKIKYPYTGALPIFKDPEPNDALENIDFRIQGVLLQSSLRPEARKMLAAIRKHADAWMLTGGTCEYAREMNRAFDLGFPKDKVIGREVWLEEFHYKFFKKIYEWRAKKKDQHAGAFLIDNAPYNDLATRLKLEFLGSDASRLFLVPSFNKQKVEETSLSSDHDFKRRWKNLGKLLRGEE